MVRIEAASIPRSASSTSAASKMESRRIALAYLTRSTVGPMRSPVNSGTHQRTRVHSVDSERSSLFDLPIFSAEPEHQPDGEADRHTFEIALSFAADQHV